MFKFAYDFCSLEKRNDEDEWKDNRNDYSFYYQKTKAIRSAFHKYGKVDICIRTYEKVFLDYKVNESLLVEDIYNYLSYFQGEYIANNFKKDNNALAFKKLSKKLSKEIRKWGKKNLHSFKGDNYRLCSEEIISFSKYEKFLGENK